LNEISAVSRRLVGVLEAAAYANAVTKLRQIEVLVAQGRTIGQACKEAEITEQSYYRWRNEYGGLEIEQAKRFKELERENARLKRLVADLSLEKQILKDVAEGNL